MPDLVPPANLHAEQAVIGACLLDRDAVIAIAPWLTADDFLIETHRHVYSGILDCYSRRVPPDLVTVADVLRQRGELAAVGDMVGLVDFTEATPTAAHVEYYARIVADCALGRAVIQAGGDIAAAGYDTDVSGLTTRAMELLHKATHRNKTADLHTAEQVSNEFQRHLERAQPAGMPTGLVDLDVHLVGGLHRGDLVLLAARPSVGKTSLALQVARNVTHGGGRVLFFSLEMARLNLWQRLISVESGIPLAAIRQSQALSDDMLGRVVEADGKLSQYPLLLDDDFSAGVVDLRARALAVQAEYGSVALVIVDYLQLVAASGRKNGNRETEVAEISRGLKRLAGELHAPVLALSQLNRSVEGRAEKVPALSDLRESGSLEQDADVVLFIHREELTKADTQRRGVADVYIAKHRQGAIGRVLLTFDAPTGRWRNHAAYSGIGRTA